MLLICFVVVAAAFLGAWHAFPNLPDVLRVILAECHGTHSCMFMHVLLVCVFSTNVMLDGGKYIVSHMLDTLHSSFPLTAYIQASVAEVS